MSPEQSQATLTVSPAMPAGADVVPQQDQDPSSHGAPDASSQRSDASLSEGANDRAWRNHDIQCPQLPACLVRTVETMTEGDTGVVAHHESTGIPEPECDHDSDDSHKMTTVRATVIDMSDRTKNISHNYHVHHHHYHHHYHTHQRAPPRPRPFPQRSREDSDDNDDSGSTSTDGCNLSAYDSDGGDYVGSKGDDGSSRVTILRSCTIVPLSHLSQVN